ncbi:MAG TPA: citrate synthase/methylcitrate synthase [Thermoanaerobaculia bacterium]|jgi:citrate synthase|nr:citrate synthase/methylcitrate synthase [Thermoanaerobaculia bacterium]
MSTSAPAYSPGLEGIVAAETHLSHVDGEAGKLILAGLPVEVLAPTATFEETVHLFWEGSLPSRDQLDRLERELADRRELPAATHDLLRAAARAGADPMDTLRTAASTLSLLPGAGNAEEDAKRLVAAFPTIVAAHWRLRSGEQPIAPDPSLGHVANYLYMLEGKRPHPRRERALTTYVNTVVDHGMNASTFTARVIISTRSDVVSAVVGAVGALKGPLHGGAPGPALDMVFEIGEASRAEAVVRRMIERGDRMMGFGHRVYKVRDPRADVLSRAATTLADQGEAAELHALARAVEETVLRLLEEMKPGRRLKTNVEYYTALLLHGIGLPKELFTPTFAIGRVGGWTAHCFEQLQANRLIRPASIYTGEEHGRWTPIEERA